MSYMSLRVKGVDSSGPAINQSDVSLSVLHCTYSVQYKGYIRMVQCNLKHIYKRNMKHTYFSSHVSAERNAE